jgi:hypothetical protein
MTGRSERDVISSTSDVRNHCWDGFGRGKKVGGERRMPGLAPLVNWAREPAIEE